MQQHRKVLTRNRDRVSPLLPLVEILAEILSLSSRREAKVRKIAELSCVRDYVVCDERGRINYARVLNPPGGCGEERCEGKGVDKRVHFFFHGVCARERERGQAKVRMNMGRGG